MKKFLILMTFVLLCLPAVCDTIQEPAQRCDPNDFCIMPWGSEAGDGGKYDYEQYFTDCYDAGFNNAGFIPIEEIQHAKQHNLTVNLMCQGLRDDTISDFTERANNWTDKIKKQIKKEDLDNIFQIFTKDEPGLKDAPEIAAYAKAISENLHKRPYINMFPDYAGEALLGGTYPDYLNGFLDACKLDYISYDNYSLFMDRGLDEDRFYYNIETVRNITIERGIHFVNIILSLQHFNYAKIDDYAINVQGWSTLAYGGRGLTYFKFHNALRGNYRGGAYDRYGSKTDVWYLIRNMNFAIHNIMPYYKDLKNVNVFHVGNVPKGCRGEETKILVESYTPTVPHIEKENPKPNLLIGEFMAKDGTPYAIVVNKDPKYSVLLNTFVFKGYPKTSVILDYSVAEKNRIMPFKSEYRWLAPGYGFLLRGEK